MFIDFSLNNVLLGLLAMGFAFLVCYCSVPFVTKLAWKIGAIDDPAGNKRRMHSVPIPRIGGLAIFIAYTVTVLIFAKLNIQNMIVMLCATIIVILGILDDKFQIKALLKLAGQLFTAVLTVVVGGLKIESIHIGEKLISFGKWSVPITIFWIVAIINAVNLIDGLDGLACGISAISSFALLSVALMKSDAYTALTLLILCGAMLGFLPSNVYPAKIFMGDTGAMFIGYMLSVLSIRGVFKLHAVISFAVPLLIFGVPLFDTFFAFFRRIFTGKNPFRADRGHIHHMLVDSGVPHKDAVLLLYAISAILSIGAVLSAYGDIIKSVAVILCGLLFGLAYFIYSMNKNKDNSQNEEGKK